VNLIEADFQIEARELSQGFLAQGATAVEIIPPRQIAGGKMGFVRRDIAGQAAGN
jgi:uncharacterized protein YrrD